MNPFLHACGATGPLQFTVECQGAHQTATVEFDQPFVLIGRDPRSDLRFSHPDVSDRHVYLQVVGGHLCYVDLGSRTGTYLDGRCLRSGWLPLQKTLRVGPYRIRLVGGVAEEPVPAAVRGAGFAMPPLKDATPAPVTLELTHRGIRPEVCPIHGELTLVGSSADCDVRVLDPSVSNYHASLLYTSAGVWVVDLLGTEGVTVNGDAVRFSRVEDGDGLRVGQSVVRVRSGTLPELDEAAAEEPTVAAPSDLLPVAAHQTAARTELAESLSAAILESLLSPLVDRLRLMQHEMFEQLRHELAEELSRTGTEIIRQLSAAHQEQASAWKQELDVVKAELVARAEAPRDHRERSVSAEPLRLGRASAVLDARPWTLNGNRLFAQAGSDDESCLTSADEVGMDCAPPPVVPDALDSQAEPEAAAITTEEAQSWLYQRISMIQGEQQGRWQRLLDGLPGQLLSRLPV